MRLVDKRRVEWAQFEEFFTEDAELLFLRGGVVEVVRMGQGDPIVLVPGLAGGWKLLAPLARRLARRHEVILYGLRGDRSHFGSTKPVHLSELADDLLDLIGALRLERPTIFGVSFGGAVALELAIEHPEKVGGLIVQGIEARFQQSLGATIARRVCERFPLPRDNHFLNQFFNLLHGGKPDPGPLVDFVIERCWETDQWVMAQRLKAIESFDVSDQLWRIEAPTLVLAGSRDAIVPAARQRALAESIAGARFETLEGAGHIGFLTHAADVAKHAGRLIRAGHRTVC